MEKGVEIKHAGLSAKQNLIVAVLIVVFFVGIIVVYYVMLYSETRNNIINKGELAAVSASAQIDKYLNNGVGVITLTAYTLDNMIAAGRSQDEMLDYLENQSSAVSNILTGNSTGIYGYINDEYLDGSGWIPDEDYVPTERPWYIDAMHSAGKIVVVDPYLDAQTGTVLITLAKTLYDGKSVVALDFSLEQLQAMTEEIAAEGDSDFEIVLDHNYKVIAHSDRNEVGKNYMNEKGTLGYTIAEQLMMSQGNFFEMVYGKGKYFVYKMSIENDWVCLSVIDTRPAFTRLSLPLLLMMIAAVFIIMTLIVIMIRFNNKSALADRMKELADIQTRYAYYDQMTGLKNRRAYSEMLNKFEENMPEDCNVIMFDVNGLKNVNDTNGHEAGDELIIAAAECIRSAFEGTEDIFRLGGDEFCVILCGDVSIISACIRKLERSAAEYKGKYINGFSISYGTGSAAGSSGIEAVLKEADSRMYEFKNSYYVSTGRDRRGRRSE